jgi:hypothetical protein
MKRRILSWSVAFCLLGAVLPLAADEPQKALIWSAREGNTTLHLNPHLLRDLGMEVRSATPGRPTEGGDYMAYTFAAPAPWTLQFTVSEGAVRNFTGGVLRHLGDVTLSFRSGSVSLANFELRPGTKERTFEILDGQGRVLLLADHMHMRLEPEAARLAVFNMDLRLSRTFAELLGEPRHEGLAIGVLTLDAAVTAPVDHKASLQGSCTSPQWDLDVDVGLIGMGSVTQTARQDGRVVVTPSATLRNVGAADVPWYQKFSGTFPPFNNDQHPFLVWAFYRVSDNRLRMIGQSQVKHAFLTINSNCPCSSGNILWAVGCEDTYGTGTNSSRNNLAFRDEIEAHLGIWNRCGSHFDQNCDGAQDPGTGNGTDVFDRRMAIPETELQVSPATYYADAWYLVRDDINIFNTMGYHQVTPVFSGSTWSFGLGPFTLGPVINAWVNPANPGLGNSNTTITTVDGHVQVAARTTDLGGGNIQYSYAVMNHDFDRQIRSFSVPLGPGVTPTDIFFGDLNQSTADDWQATVAGGSITWSTPPGDPGANALDWGTLYSFSFVVQGPPVPATATLGILEPGIGTTLTTGTVAPIAAGIFSDGFESGDTSAWSSTVEP